MIEHLCVSCGDSFYRYNTLQKYCQKCAYNKYAKPAKPIKRFGKKAKAWSIERTKWIEENPPTNNYWQCYLRISPQCLRDIDIDQLTLDHVIPRSKHQPTKILPACIFCNGLKGSRTIEALCKTYPHLNGYRT